MNTECQTACDIATANTNPELCLAPRRATAQRSDLRGVVAAWRDVLFLHVCQTACDVAYHGSDDVISRRNKRLNNNPALRRNKSSHSHFALSGHGGDTVVPAAQTKTGGEI
jgi:hypothetical protein